MLEDKTISCHNLGVVIICVSFGLFMRLGTNSGDRVSPTGHIPVGLGTLWYILGERGMINLILS